MGKYIVKWSDGYGAASRGIDIDSIVRSTIVADSDKEAIKLAYLLRKTVGLCTDIKDINSVEEAEATLKEAVLDYFNIDDLEEDYAARLEYVTSIDVLPENAEKYLNAINDDGIDGGSPWIITITSPDGREIYDSGMYISDPDELAEILPCELIIPKDVWDDTIENCDEDGEIEGDPDTVWVANCVIDEVPEFMYLVEDRVLFEFDERIGAMSIANCGRIDLPNGDIKLVNIVWEANYDI